jgi:alpha-ketoglutarate-dependent taurine dioxygenase
LELIDPLKPDYTSESIQQVRKQGYILNKENIVKINWEMNDLLIFNNRKLIHSSSPSIEYENYERLYYSCFLGTDAPIIKCNSI